MKKSTIEIKSLNPMPLTKDIQDGYRIFVEPELPQGRKLEDLHVDEWCRELAPKKELLQFLLRNPDKHGDFMIRYTRQLGEDPDTLKKIHTLLKKKHLCLIYFQEIQPYPPAEALKKFFEKIQALKIKHATRRREPNEPIIPLF